MPASPPVGLSVEDFCASLGSEDAHGRHVAALALQLFDATHAWFGMPAAERPVLEAACRLHDLGYRVAARGHAEVGSELILSEGLHGFTADQRARIALLVRLHAAPVTFEAARATVRRYPDALWLLYAAGLLRLADGLDYCHRQDTTIVSIRATKRRLRIGIRSGPFPGNLVFARGQLARWRGAFPVDLELRPMQGGARRLPPDLIPGVSVPEALRRLLFPQYRTVLLNVDGALGAAGSEALHDLRIAVRRMRIAMRAFRKALRPFSGDRIDRDLQQLNRILGPARDLDVWIDFVSTPAMLAEFAGHRLWPAFVAHQFELRRLQQVTVQRQLRGAHFAALRHRLDRWLRVELSGAAGSGAYPAWEKPAARVFARAVRRALDLGHLRHSEEPDKLHRLRIALRRVRYLGGFFGDGLGRPVQKVSRRAHAVEGMLGGIRDADLALDRIRREGPPPPRLLVRHLGLLRKTSTAAVERAWQRFEAPQLEARLRQILKG